MYCLIFAYWLCKSPSSPPFRYRVNSISVFYTLYTVYTKCDTKIQYSRRRKIEARKYIETYINQQMAIKICQVKFLKILKLWDHPKTIGSSNKHEFNHKTENKKIKVNHLFAIWIAVNLKQIHFICYKLKKGSFYVSPTWPMPGLIWLCLLVHFRDNIGACRKTFTVKIDVIQTKHCIAFNYNYFLFNFQIQKCKKYAKRLHKIIFLLPYFYSNEENGFPAKSHQSLFLNHSNICY